MHSKSIYNTPKFITLCRLPIMEKESHKVLMVLVVGAYLNTFTIERNFQVDLNIFLLSLD